MSQEAAIIQATSAGVKDMADGSLRITFEFDPRFAKDAYALFGARGTSCAIAALTQEASLQAAQQETIKDQPKEPIGPLCRLAVQFCADPMFQEWLSSLTPGDWPPFTEEEARQEILNGCDIASRRELDTNNAAADLFHQLYRKPFMAWRDQRSAA